MEKLGPILCPIDFSDASEHAAEQAVTIARWYGAPLIALHVYTPAVAVVPSLPEAGDRAQASLVRQLHDRTLALVQTACGCDAAVDVAIDSGYAPVEILRNARRVGAGLIVMGTHGLGGFERFVLGSVTEKVLRKATCPVLTVPPRTHSTSRFPFTRVLVAIDFSDWSLAALAFASSLAHESDAALTLVHVVDWPWREPPPPDLATLPSEQAAALDEYRRYAERSAGNRMEALIGDDGQSRGHPVGCRVLHGKPYVEILRMAAEENSDLIVLGVHGRNPVDLALFGSTANQIVRRATCPVLTLRQ